MSFWNYNNYSYVSLLRRDILVIHLFLADSRPIGRVATDVWHHTNATWIWTFRLIPCMGSVPGCFRRPVQILFGEEAPPVAGKSRSSHIGSKFGGAWLADRAPTYIIMYTIELPRTSRSSHIGSKFGGVVCLVARMQHHCKLAYTIFPLPMSFFSHI
jgi:hypothetical protein